MISAKDTFYLMLRDRIAALNPARTMGLRGVIRPGVLVEENELVTADIVPNVFRLRWTALQINVQSTLSLATMTCEIRYTTDGDAGNGGMDRGRLLAQMDAELSSALRATPHHIVKTNYATGFGVAPIAMATHVFWSDVAFSPTVVAEERLER
ncbi:MAG: hypothetical protein ABI197_04120, partial [Granulicella sp.]